jgi:hypothetical protein
MYPITIQKIHKDFLTAGDKLLADSKRILEISFTDKAKRLKQAGFKGVTDVKELAIIEGKQSEARKQAELIEYYAQNYPLNKFVTQKTVMDICSKYKLVFGEISDFTGFVPEKNLSQIENFKVSYNDKISLIRVDSVTFWTSDKARLITQQIKSFLKRNNGIVAIDERDSDRFYIGRDYYVEKAIAKAMGVSSITTKGISYKSVQSFLICASAKEMKKWSIKYLFAKPDPVVLQPVKGGYLIVTAWGDEASDPEVINGKLN